MHVVLVTHKLVSEHRNHTYVKFMGIRLKRCTCMLHADANSAPVQLKCVMYDDPLQIHAVSCAWLNRDSPLLGCNVAALHLHAHQM